MGHFQRPSTPLMGKSTKKRLDEVVRLLATLEALGRSRRKGDRWSNAA